MTKKGQLTKPSGNALQIYAQDEAEAQRQVAQTLTSPSVNAALVISASKIVEAWSPKDSGKRDKPSVLSVASLSIPKRRGLHERRGAAP
jgi:hypothetical protein